MDYHNSTGGKMYEKRQQFNFKMDRNTREALALLATRLDRTRSSVIRHLIQKAAQEVAAPTAGQVHDRTSADWLGSACRQTLS